jgi:hypothetical protein
MLNLTFTIFHPTFEETMNKTLLSNSQVEKRNQHYLLTMKLKTKLDMENETDRHFD